MRPGRLGLSAIDKREIWSRWRAGQTLHEIGRAYGKCHNTIRAVLLPCGGIPPIARRRSRLALTFAEREDISRGMASGSSMREIAGRLHRATSTVSREVARHGGRPAYRAYDADQQAWNAALRPKRCLFAVNSALRDVVASKLILDWSPEQIAGWLKAQYPHNASMRVSHETIYRSLFHERMHRTLKMEATRPAGSNFLQQQAKFDAFVHEFTNEHPHEALDMKYPAEIYKPSTRPYRGIGELSYPFHDRTALVTCCGRICIYRKKINLSTSLAGQTVGIKEVDEGIWLVSFMDYDLGYIDLEEKTLQPLDNPFGPRV